MLSSKCTEASSTRSNSPLENKIITRRHFKCVRHLTLASAFLNLTLAFNDTQATSQTDDASPSSGAS